MAAPMAASVLAPASMAAAAYDAISSGAAIADSVDMVENNLERAQTDPLNLGIIPLPINLAYHIGRFIAERQAARYKSAIAERDSVQMRLMYLRQIDQGQADPILRGEIEVSQSRVEKLNYKIKEMEEKWV